MWRGNFMLYFSSFAKIHPLHLAILAKSAVGFWIEYGKAENEKMPKNQNNVQNIQKIKYILCNLYL